MCADSSIGRWKVVVVVRAFCLKLQQLCWHDPGLVDFNIHVNRICCVLTVCGWCETGWCCGAAAKTHHDAKLYDSVWCGPLLHWAAGTVVSSATVDLGQWLDSGLQGVGFDWKGQTVGLLLAACAAHKAVLLLALS